MSGGQPTPNIDIADIDRLIAERIAPLKAEIKELRAASIKSLYISDGHTVVIEREDEKKLAVNLRQLDDTYLTRDDFTSELVDVANPEGMIDNYTTLTILHLKEKPDEAN